MKCISSKNNQYIKFIRQLHQKKERKKSGKFYIEGLRLIGEALHTGFPIESIVFCSELLISDFGWKTIEEGKNEEIDIIEVTKDVFLSFALKENPQGIAAVGFQNWEQIVSLQPLEGLWIALDKVQDPGNLGTIMRSLDGASGKGLILLGNTTDAYHPTTIRASMGALFSLKIGRASISEFHKWIMKESIPVIGSICEEGKNYKNFDFPKDMILLMGSEQKGLSNNLLEMCEDLVTIPMIGSVDSLNLACAASIILFEIYAKNYSQ